MIDSALKVLRGEIQNYLVRLPDLNINNQDKVKLSHVVNQEGALAIDIDNLSLSLVNIEEERVLKSQNAVMTNLNGQKSQLNPEIKLNLYILITPYFDQYDTGLKYLSAVIRFFQGKNVFTPQNTPALDPVIEKLIVDLHTLNFEQQNHLWGALGAKYMPSVLYKVRLIAIQEGLVIDLQPPITEIRETARGI